MGSHDKSIPTSSYTLNTPLSPSLTCEQRNEDRGIAQVPKHKEFSPRGSRCGNMTKQVDMSIPESLFKAQNHLRECEGGVYVGGRGRRWEYIV